MNPRSSSTFECPFRIPEGGTPRFPRHHAHNRRNRFAIAATGLKREVAAALDGAWSTPRPYNCLTMK